jgi:hypothetical protein
MSNVGDVTISILPDMLGDMEKLYPNRALLALDFIVPKYSNKMYAIDLNISPGLRWTGIEDILSAKEVVEYIKNYKQEKILKW